jgi:hypothetical protein
MLLGGYVKLEAFSKHGEDRNIYKILVGKPDGKGLLSRHKCRW